MVTHRFADQTFLLIIASDKGKGKSIRADRFAALMPDGWTSENGANSARAGMNGTLAVPTTLPRSRLTL